MHCTFLLTSVNVYTCICRLPRTWSPLKSWSFACRITIPHFAFHPNVYIAHGTLHMHECAHCTLHSIFSVIRLWSARTPRASRWTFSRRLPVAERGASKLWAEGANLWKSMKTLWKTFNSNWNTFEEKTFEEPLKKPFKNLWLPLKNLCKPLKNLWTGAEREASKMSNGNPGRVQKDTERLWKSADFGEEAT